MSMPRSPLQQFRPALLGAVLSVSVFTLIACRQEAPAAEQPAVVAPASGTAPAAETPSADAAPAFLSSLSEGMAYADLRRAVTSAGWQPLRDLSCWENVGGEAAVCDALPEVESCSGDGACLMRFADPGTGRRLQVTTYGPYERWNVPGEESALAVRSWDLQAAPATAAAACPSGDFDAFLQRFAADDGVREAYTAPVVEVGELYVDAQGNDAARTVYVAAGAYRDFDITYRDGAYRHVDADGATGAGALPVKVESPSADTRLVRFDYGMSEGNSYRFERRAGCWVMTGDPEPPSP